MPQRLKLTLATSFVRVPQRQGAPPLNPEYDQGQQFIVTPLARLRKCLRRFHVAIFAAVGSLSAKLSSIDGSNDRRTGASRWTAFRRASAALAALVCAVAIIGPPAAAQVAAVRHFHVTRYKSITFTSPTPFATAIAGNTDIADILPMSDRTLYIQGKRVGTTNVTLYDQDKRFVMVIDLDVTLDIADIQRRIASGTESRGIRVSSIKGQIVLGGEARNAVDAERAVSIARSLVTTDDGREVDPKDAEKYVVNAMRVAPSQQVMLRVRFVEVDRSAERDIGVNWFGANTARTAGAKSAAVRSRRPLRQIRPPAAQ